MYEKIFIVWVCFSVADEMKLNVNQFFLESNCVRGDIIKCKPILLRE